MKNLFFTFVVMFLFNINLVADQAGSRTHALSDAGVINYVVSKLSDQLTNNKDFSEVNGSSIAITSFVSLEDFKATSRLSKILSENFIHEMQVRGYKVVDFKTMDKIKVDEKGDFLFSRNIAKLRKTLHIDYALTGTCVKYRKGTVVNARIIDLKTHIVLSSAQILIPRHIVKSIASVGNKIQDFKSNTISLFK